MFRSILKNNWDGAFARYGQFVRDHFTSKKVSAILTFYELSENRIAQVERGELIVIIKTDKKYMLAYADKDGDYQTCEMNNDFTIMANLSHYKNLSTIGIKHNKMDSEYIRRMDRVSDDR